MPTFCQLKLLCLQIATDCHPDPKERDNVKVSPQKDPTFVYESCVGGVRKAAIWITTQILKKCEKKYF